MSVTIRRAAPEDAEAVAGVINGVIAEGQYTVFDRPFSTREEWLFLSGLSDREVVHAAFVEGELVGVQSLGRFSVVSDALRHVATMGTWISSAYRGKGIGRAIARASLEFAVDRGYRKILIYVLSDNAKALTFYQALGFTAIGTARNQACLRGEFKDEVFLEMPIQGRGPEA